MRNKKLIIFVILILAVGAVFLQQRAKRSASNGEIIKEIKPFTGAIENVISTTGTVLPKNRLEIKPPVNGRVDEILVREGEKVKAGQVLAWMSSTERAALLDAARGKGEEELKYWREVYKPIALISPIDGEVIVATTQPGQTVTTNDAVVVLSDQLIVRAQVDETDIGKIKLGQNAVIILDAYPDTKIKASADHIYYESKTVNNVTIYEVDLMPETVAPFFRSGMNATINFIETSKNEAVLVPSEAVFKEKNEAFVYVKGPNGREAIKRSVKLGMTDDKNVEILSGLDANDTVILKTKKYELPKSNGGGNPFMPARRR
ncbi:MAG: efflux RND transporter periplasmic adaptor subunit [Candidatus Omnitrophota bacterium]